MCGIVGIVAFNGVVDPRRLQRMNDLLEHRGPDGEGFMFASGVSEGRQCAFHRRADDVPVAENMKVGLGHRRLAILDLSDRGLQPMRSSNGRAWVVFNGEIYNHVRLRTQLATKGHVFGTRTDTEVLVNAYAEWGDECVDRLDGMFAFAVWDSARARLFCARDRFGIKPFYYATTDGYFAFASEIKALAALPECRRGADDEAVIGFLAHGNCDYAERTLFRDIHALPAAHTLTVDVHGGMRGRRYWALATEPAPNRDDQNDIQRLRDSLVSSVRSHLISDVRVGSCLSGGLDSSTLVSVIGELRRRDPAATEAIGDRLYTFTSCYDDASIDERAYALEVADSVGANAQLVFPSASDFWSELPRIAWHQDMPFGSFSFYAQWRVMRAARDAGVKVLIDGQGGDEVFGGYAKFRYAQLLSLLKRGHVGKFTREMAGMFRQRDPYLLDIRAGYRYLPSPMRRVLNVDSALQGIVRRDWQHAVANDSTPATRWWRYARQSGHHNGNGAGWTFMQRMQVDDITVDTLPQLLRMEDRSSMAFSLEARVPLLDHRLVQSAVSLPDDLKVNGGFSKYAVREAMRGILPERVRKRTTKLGFAAPDRRWLADDLHTSVADLVNNDLRCQRYVDVHALRRWHRSPHARRANAASFLGLFRIVSLEAWMRAFDLS
jgi:asparagine synthase (glutamine-hydrolysing)